MSTASEFVLEYTCNHPGNVSFFDTVMEAYLGARANVPELLTDLLDREPEMPMAICLQGYLLKLAAHPKLESTLKEFLARAEALKKTNHREQLHIQALSAWVAQRDAEALALLEEILAHYPADVCALRVAHYLHFYRGKGATMAESTARVATAYGEHDPNHAYYLGMHAFGLEEAGELKAAEDLGRRAATLNPADLWAIHAVDHALYTKEEHTKGIDWLKQHESHWSGTNNFRYHLHWHIALHFLKLDDFAAALGIYDSELEKSLSDDFYLDVCNNASLLWRLEHRGVDVGNRWHEIAEIAKNHTGDQELVFASLHYLLALHRTQSADLYKLCSTLESWSALENDQGEVCAKVGLPALQTLKRETDSDWQENLYLVGGSHAQRELFHELEC